MSSQVSFTRSGMDCLKKCERLYWYSYVMNGTGMEPERPYLELTLGLAVHKGMEILFKRGSDIEAAISEAINEWRKLTEGLDFIVGSTGEQLRLPSIEQESLISALLLAWRMKFWEDFNNEFEILKIESEMASPAADGIYLQSRCDLVVRRRSDGAVLVPDWKCVRDARDWHLKYIYESQTYSQQWAVSQALGEEVAGSVYWALIKGGRKYGEQLSPLIYGYKKRILNSEAFEYSAKYQAGAGWRKFPVWEENFPGMEGQSPSMLDRIRYWLFWIPEETLTAQFCQSPEVLPNHELTESWLSEAVENVKWIHENLEGPPSKFQRNMSSWNCKGCWARRACIEGEDPGELGWKVRQPHHAPLEGVIE